MAKGTEYLNGWKSKWVFTSKLIPLYTDFLHNIIIYIVSME